MPQFLKRATMAVALAAVSSAPLVLSAPRAAAATMPATISVLGHGYGHGRGMGQYGAYGYALDGWTYEQILNQYYGGTTLAGTSATTINVVLDELGAPTSLSVSVPTGQTVYVNGTNTKQVSATLSRGQTATSSGGADITVAGSFSTGSSREFAGSIQLSSSGQVVNDVSLESYVEGVVPREMPASWSPAALEAQAVAARTYALAYLADDDVSSICDNSYCQNYGGDPAQYYGGDSSASNAAVAATGNQVLECTTTGACGNAGQLAFTEYSASTGGYTGGGDFPAVPDVGDGNSGIDNPYHTWSTTISTSSIEADWPQVGALEQITITSRNGYGDWGGRVEEMNLIGTGGTVEVTGDEFADYLGLLSDWFTLSSQTAPAGSDNGYWVVAADGSVFNYGQADNYGSMAGKSLAAPVVGMEPTTNDAGYWLAGANGAVYPFGNAGNYGSAASLPLGTPVIGLAATNDDGGYWLFSRAGGVFSYGDATFYGSAVPYHPITPVIAAAATPRGGGYWLVTSAGGVFTFGDASFHGAAASLPLSAPIVAILPTSDGGGYWLISANGGVLAYGDAAFKGSMGGTGQTGFVSVSSTPDQGGYLLVTSSGSVDTFGDATWLGDPADSDPGWTGRAVGVYSG